jgi:hypothetical protein
MGLEEAICMATAPFTRATTRQKHGAVRLPFRVVCDTFGPGRAFVQARVKLMLAEIEADAWPRLLR